MEAAALAANLASNCGWTVFPVRDDKRPACPHGFKDGANEPGAIIALWARYPGPLIGIATGAVSGIDALDIDLKHEAALHWWRANLSRVPPTRTYRTRSGGLHLYFAHAPGLRCSAGKLAEGVDTRADGGYLVSWFAAGLECLDHAPAVPWPGWLLTALLPKPEPVRVAPAVRQDQADRATDGALRMIVAAPEGQRNRVVHWAACRIGERVRAGQIGAAEAEALLIAAASAAGLAEHEARRTVRSGLGRAA